MLALDAWLTGCFQAARHRGWSEVMVVFLPGVDQLGKSIPQPDSWYAAPLNLSSNITLIVHFQL